MKRKRWTWPALAVAMLVCHWEVSFAGVAGAVPDALNRPASPSKIASHAVLLDIAVAGDHVVAVGERGIILYSDDKGKSWQQASVPTSVSLVAVTFPTAAKGWAVGHGGLVLHSEDGGQTWQRQLDGDKAAKLALDKATRLARAEPENVVAQRQLRESVRLVEEGADKPFLDLAFADDRRGFVVGAYGIIFRTDNGGADWEPWMERVDNPRGMHLYAVDIVGDDAYLAGEQGLFLRSDDGGEHFSRVSTPYEGTYFSLSANAAGEVLLVGLRGHAYWSADRGDTFAPSRLAVPVSLSAVAGGSRGAHYFANQAGLLLGSVDGGRTITPLPAPHLPPVSALVEVGPDELLTVGAGGVIPVFIGSAGVEGGAR